MTQNQRVLDYMRDNPGITPLEAMGKLGIYRLSARISDLRREGHSINSTRVTVKNRFGEKCSVAFYSLEGKDGNKQ